MKTKRQKIIITIIVSILISSLVSIVHSHCQIPCGIYGDPTRFEIMAEHIKTIEKSMKTIGKLSSEEKLNYNQIVRWVNNKDEHADKFAHEVTYYFMAQRVKPVDKSDHHYNDYVKKVTILHQMLVYSMKCKQTTDLEDVEKLKQLLTEFKTSYFAEHKH